MTSKVRTSAGTKLFVSATNPTTYDKTGFTAVSSWTEVAEITDLGSFGKKYNVVTFNPLGSRMTVKRKGSYNSGTMSIKLGSNVTDPGQVLMVTASTDDASYSFKVVTQSGSTYYFTGQVTSWQIDVGSVDQILGATCDLEIDNDIVTDTLTA